MTNIAAFLTARLDEDEQCAREAEADWTPTSPDLPRGTHLVYGLERVGYGIAYQGFASVWEPARVLADVAAKRAIIAEVAPPRKPETNEQLHARRAHPAYEYETTEGQRKAWDRADEPPEGCGWERNTDAGRNGWDRFDYVEESYWRRLLPNGPPPPYVPLILRYLASVYADHPDYDESWRP